MAREKHALTGEDEDFLEAIHAAPHDDGLRLTYAGWMEDQGETEFAEMIRLGVGIGRADVPPQTQNRIDELDKQLRPRFVSPVPPGWKFTQWERGLPWVTHKNNGFSGDAGTPPAMPLLYCFHVTVFFRSVNDLVQNLSSRLMKQTHAISFVGRPQITIEHAQAISRATHFYRLEYVFLREVKAGCGEAVMDVLSGCRQVEILEKGYGIRSTIQDARSGDG